MGIYADVLANAIAWDAGGADELSVGPDRIITMEIERLRDKGDVGYPSGYTEVDEVQELNVMNGAVSGTWWLQINLANGDTLETQTLLHDVAASSVQIAINDRGSGNIAGWTNGDISVSGGDFPNNAIILTFDGNSVKGDRHPLIETFDNSLTGNTVQGVTETTPGQKDRTAMGILNLLGIVTTPPSQGDVAGLVANADREANPGLPRQVTLQALAKQASIDERSEELYTELMKAFGLQDLL